MSWNIYIYAETKSKGSDEWKPLYDKPLFESYKLYKDDFYDSFKNIKASDCSINDVKTIQPTLFNTSADIMVKCCSLHDFTEHYKTVVNNFNLKLRSAYLALDLGITVDYDDIYVEQEFESEDSDNNENILFSRMTNPVSKKLMIDLANSFNNLSKAHEMIGLANTVYSMTPYGNSTRLIFAVM